jgi:hypothetical protein
VHGAGRPRDRLEVRRGEPDGREVSAQARERSGLDGFEGREVGHRHGAGILPRRGRRPQRVPIRRGSV